MNSTDWKLRRELLIARAWLELLVHESADIAEGEQGDLPKLIAGNLPQIIDRINRALNPAKAQKTEPAK